MLEGLTEWELVAKANEAVELMEQPEHATKFQFIGAKMLANSGVVYESNVPDAAQWVQENKRSFVDKFSSMSVIKDRTVSVIVEYVPVGHVPEALAEQRKIERD